MTLTLVWPSVVKGVVLLILELVYMRPIYWGGLRLPLNVFAREILHRLGISINQLNPKAWRLIISMQTLWREVFDGNCPLTVDEFLYFYKPLEISQSLVFYQFFARGSSCRLVKSLLSSDRRWKTDFFFVSGFWAGNPVEVGRDPFPPYTGEMGHLRPEGILFFFCSSYLFFFVIFS